MIHAMNSSSNPVREPEEWPHAFTTCLEAGQLDAILALYEPGARMLAPPQGGLVAGHSAIRSVVAGLIQSRARLKSNVVRCVRTGDVAVLYTDFEGVASVESGEAREISQRAIEVLRRQTDGTWKLIFGDPMGRGGD